MIFVLGLTKEILLDTDFNKEIWMLVMWLLPVLQYSIFPDSILKILFSIYWPLHFWESNKINSMRWLLSTLLQNGMGGSRLFLWAF